MKCLQLTGVIMKLEYGTRCDYLLACHQAGLFTPEAIA